MSNCDICSESFNNTNRAIVKCICDFQSCRECVKTYLLNRNEEPCCMSCKIQWERNFLSNNLEKSFMTKEYKVYRENLLYERELAMLQATQPHVEKEIRLEELTFEIKKLTQEYNSRLANFHLEIKNLENDVTCEKRKFIRKCPNGDCLGFLSSSLKCNLCKCNVCVDCREIKSENHICDKNILESVKLLQKDSKPCPKCSSLIFKIEGCDQMFCVECHTAFSWRTLKIENGIIHNPHYFEYQRQANNGSVPRNPLDIQCGRELDNNFVKQLIRTFKKNHEIIDICRNIIHIRFVDQQKFNIPDRLTNNLKERIEFMRKKIDINIFKKQIQKKEKRLQKNTELNNILAMFVTSMTDIIYRALNNPKKYNLLKMEMENLRRYTNECFKNTSLVYNSKCYEINNNFKFC
jgi:hypothetical protein